MLAGRSEYQVGLKGASGRNIRKMPNRAITNSIRSMSLLTFSYDLSTRIVEPHAYGQTDEGKNVMRAYQTSGRPGWRLFQEDEMRGISVLLDTFRSKRPGYKRNDSEMERIFQQL